MRCPYCMNPETKVVDKRDSEEEPVTRRRRECLKCSKRFTTYERAEMQLIVVKKDGRREQYNRQKLVSGVQKACEKRPISQEQIEKLADEVEAELRQKDSTEIPSKTVGDIVMKKLRKLDKIAYIRFASVYKAFDDLKEFEEELKKVV